MGLLRGHSHLKGLVDTPRSDRCIHASETATKILCDCEALAKLRLRHLGQHCMAPDDSEDTFICRLLHCVQDAALLNA
jgi:hypothetical protein